MRTIEELETIFREFVLRSINTGLYNHNLPQASFVKIINAFAKRTGRLGIMKKEYFYWWNVYVKVLSSAGRNISIENPYAGISERKKSIVTPQMIREAPGRELYHSVRAGD